MNLMEYHVNNDKSNPPPEHWVTQQTFEEIRERMRERIEQAFKEQEKHHEKLY